MKLTNRLTENDYFIANKTLIIMEYLLLSNSGWCPNSGSCRYTQVQPKRKIRHFGMDAEIQAMDGNQQVAQVLD